MRAQRSPLYPERISSVRYTQSFSTFSPAEPRSSSPLTPTFKFIMTFIPLRTSQSGHGLRQQTTMMPRRAKTHPGGTRPKATSACLSQLIS